MCEVVHLINRHGKQLRFCLEATIMGYTPNTPSSKQYAQDYCLGVHAPFYPVPALYVETHIREHIVLQYVKWDGLLHCIHAWCHDHRRYDGEFKDWCDVKDTM